MTYLRIIREIRCDSCGTS